MATEAGTPSRANTAQADEVTPGSDLAQTSDYHAYLLRLWRTGAGEWRGSLQSAQNGERHLFAELDDLFVFLRAQLHREDVAAQRSK